MAFDPDPNARWILTRNTVPILNPNLNENLNPNRMKPMKRYLLLFVWLFAAAACSREESGPMETDESVNIDLSVGVVSDYTRAGADETVVADRCILEIYNADGTLYPEGRLIAPIEENGTCTFHPAVVSGRSYRFVLWADKSGAALADDLHYITSNGLRNITIDRSRFALCDMNLDAYSAVVDFPADGGRFLSATLQRAVCRLNVSSGFRPGQTGPLSVNVAFPDVDTTFDALTGAVGEGAALQGGATLQIASTEEPVSWFVYLPAPAGAGLRTIDFNMTAAWRGETTPVFSYAFEQIPLQRNYRVQVVRPASGTTSVRME